ncbi:ATPase family AAA domain-containing protein 5 isoform X1 [Eleutherodactylus coqui]|uniref:ATPase family AAA domain-containing protein 5 isoform X1 n=1 Tax=Eleutherodactylus coqui TaxID=57060 RepID=UPI0034619BD6
MVGVLAVTSQLEDYAAQPCKKQRKDEEPTSKTITKYFSPISKTADKALCSPKSNNIADYFIRSPSAAGKERPPRDEAANKARPPKEEAANKEHPPKEEAAGKDCSTRNESASKDCPPRDKMDSPIFGVRSNKELPSTPLSGRSKPAGRTARRGRRTKLIKRLSDLAPPDAADNGGRNLANSRTMGSDTATLLAEICSQTVDQEGDEDFQSETSTVGGATKPRSGHRLKRTASMEAERRVNGEPLSTGPPNLPQSESNTSMVDTSLEVHVDSTSYNCATLTVSFEEFMKSQTRKEQSTSESSTSDYVDLTNGGDAELSSAKMLTVQAQVHLSPRPDAGSKKIASIFKKSKAENKKAAASPRDCDPVSPAAPKRKSNVVIEEEELELAVINMETGEPMKQKATLAERQQFMKAFRQAGDTSKPNAKKNPARKKDLKEGTEKLEAEEQALDKDVNEETKAEEADKPKKKRPAGTPSVKTPEPAAEEEPQTPLLPNSPVLRRSLRRQSNPSSKSPERTSAESPLLMSTPKNRTPYRRNAIYKAEVITMPSDTESPIRMRFTRVTRRNKCQQLDSDNEVFTTGCKTVSKSSKKISKAKKLLEKAKAIQQNMVKAETPHRRSTRKKRDVMQKPIVIADTTASSKKDAQKTTNLRSLNDVLGKKVKSKNRTSGQKKEIKKVNKGGVITIDDSSEVSENSQVNKQFKAKREFLLSGLPDSLKRQIAKTTAMMEAYSLTGSSFQTVIHVQQRDDCITWSLPMPCCSMLTDLSPLCTSVPDITQHTLSLGDFTCVNSQSVFQQTPALVPNRLVFSDLIQSCLLEEIRLYNPQFPVKRFFKQFLQKQKEYLSLPDANKSAMNHMEKYLKAAGSIRTANESAVEESGSGTKRKRKRSPCAKSKKRKSAVITGDEDEPQCDSAPTTRGQLATSSSRNNGSMHMEPDVIIVEESPVSVADDVFGEDVLWTEKYQPQNSSDLIGNSSAIRQLHSWLREWKIRAEKEEKKNQMQKTGKDKNDTWNACDFDNSEDSNEDSLCNTVLISGPPGVGKTAAVYACAQELGFKVFEVNASCQRSGRQILAQLKEATQSHQVDQQGVNAHKPCFFNLSNSSKSPRKVNSPKRVVSSPRKLPVSPRGPVSKKGVTHKSLTNIFLKAAPKQKYEVKNANSELLRASQTVSDGKTSNAKASRPDKGLEVEESSRKTATSLILFEEVDVIFEDDTGFLSAIKTFMSTTKRPVILTTSDPTFGMMFDGAFEEISFHTPSVVNVASFLQVLCLAENLRTDTKDVITFLTANRCDIRQSFLHLQFWARSGGGGLREKPLPPSKQKTETIDASDGASCKYPTTEISATYVPRCSVGCAENLLGVNNIIPPTDNLISFVKEKILEQANWDKILQLLAEFHTRNLYFTSSNLEFLLPLPVHVEEAAASSACENLELGPLLDGDYCPMEDAGLKLSASMKRRRKLVLLNDSDLFESDSNSLDDVLSNCIKEPEEKSVPPSNDIRNEGLEARVVKKVLSPAELKSSFLVYRCLESMAEFSDHMSSLDCYTCDTTDPTETCTPNWTVSRLKHGLCDGLRTESRDLSNNQTCREIRAIIEALSFQKCSSKLSQTLDSSLELCKQSGKDPTEELTLHVSKAQDQVYFGQPAVTTDISERRLSVVKDILSHRAFIGLGNREVNVTEYLPTLRSICRLQKSKEEGKTKRRFLHYLEGINLELPKATLNSLAADFP